MIKMPITRINNIIFNLFIIQTVFSFVFTTKLMPIKIAILGIQAIFLALKIFNEKLNTLSRLHKITLVISLILSSVSFYIGKINGFNPMAQAKVMFIWPVLFSLVMASVSHITISRLIKSLILTTFLVNLTLTLANFLPEGWNLTKILWDSLIFSKGSSFGFYEFDARSIGSYFFLFPVTLYLLFTGKFLNNKWKYLNLINLIIMSSIIVFSFRRALILVSFCSPIVLIFTHYIVFKTFKISKKQLIAFVGSIAILLSVMAITIPKKKINNYLTSTFSAFNFIKRSDKKYNLRKFKRQLDFDRPEAIRANQMNALLSEWKKSPIFGRGLGSYNRDFTLEKEKGQKHNYDLGYFDLLMKLGLFGLIGFTILLIINYIATFKHVIGLSKPSKYYFVALFTGSICMIIANASNPYLFKFDGLWTLFIPFSFIYLTDAMLAKQTNN